jgi:hypothetical protein
LHINQSHQEIWSKTYSQPELLLIREADVDLEKHPVTEAERLMVKETIYISMLFMKPSKTGRSTRAKWKGIFVITCGCRFPMLFGRR